jgi:hypothetical protein
MPPRKDHRVPHISLVIREMWDITAFPSSIVSATKGSGKRPAVSHISRKTSEMWGTRWSVVRTVFWLGGQNGFAPKRGPH